MQLLQSMNSKPLISSFLILTILIGGVGCDFSDRIRNWGELSRRSRTKDLNEQELQKWKTDLNLSKERVQELHKSIESIVSESNLQGEISRKIARAYVSRERWDMASWQYENAIQNRPPSELQDSFNGFEESLPFFREALMRSPADPDLFYEAAIAFSNASRLMGWETQRYQTAVSLFEVASSRTPADAKPKIQLAILLSKVEPVSRRDSSRSLDLLNEVLQKEDSNIDARMAKAHILASLGNFSESLFEYRKVQQLMIDSANSGILPGDPEDNPSYKTIQNNIEMLEWCIAGDPKCELR